MKQHSGNEESRRISGTTIANRVSSTAEDDASKPAPPPNGGTLAWLQVLGGWFAFFNTWGVVNTFGAFQTAYESSVLRNESSSNISWIGSLQGFLLLFATIITGPLFDRGYGYHLQCVGAFLTVFGMFMTSIATKYWHFILAQGVCMGLGFACVFLSSIAILPTYFDTRRALAIGLVNTGAAVGSVVLTVAFANLEPRIGFPWATRVVAFIMLVMAFPPLICLRVRHLPSAPRNLLDKEALKSLPFILFSIATFFAFTGLYVPYFYSQLYAKQQAGFSSSMLAQYTLTILAAGGFAGRVIPLAITDKTGRPILTVVVILVACVILNWSWLAIDNVAGLLVWDVFYGFFSGAFPCLQQVTVAALVTNHPGRDIRFNGTWMGMISMAAGTGYLIGNPIAGAILRRAGSWVGLQAFTAAVNTLSLVFAIWAWLVFRKR